MARKGRGNRKAQGARYRLKHPDKVRAARRKYRKAHPEMVRVEKRHLRERATILKRRAAAPRPEVLETPEEIIAERDRKKDRQKFTEKRIADLTPQARYRHLVRGMKELFGGASVPIIGFTPEQREAAISLSLDTPRAFPKTPYSRRPRSSPSYDSEMDELYQAHAKNRDQALK